MHSCTLSLTSEMGSHTLTLCYAHQPTLLMLMGRVCCKDTLTTVPLSRHMAGNPGQLSANRHPSVSVTLGRHNKCSHASLLAQSLLHTDTKPAATSPWRMYMGESVRTNTHVYIRLQRHACLFLL